MKLDIPRGWYLPDAFLAFVSDSEVAPALARWHLTFQPASSDVATRDGERPYGAWHQALPGSEPDSLVMPCTGAWSGPGTKYPPNSEYFSEVPYDGSTQDALTTGKCSTLMPSPNGGPSTCGNFTGAYSWGWYQPHGTSTVHFIWEACPGMP